MQDGQDQATISPRPVHLDPVGVDGAARSVANSTGLNLGNASERNRAYGIAVQAVAEYFAAAGGR